MKQIGKGLQYRVYDLKNGRVRKVRASPIESYLRVLLSKSPRRFRPFQSMREVDRVFRARVNSIQSLKKIIGDPGLGMLLGHPVFLGGTDYEQDFCITLGRYVSSHAVNENKRILAEYIALIIKLWGYGLSDEGFNFSFNNGVDRYGTVILLDLGELTFERKDIECAIRQRKWLGQLSYISLQDQTLADFYKDEMDRAVTLETLQKHWRVLAPDQALIDP